MKKENPGLYKAHFDDCIGFGNQLFSAMNLSDLRVTDITKAHKVNKVTLARVSVWFRSLDNKLVEGFSEQEVAKMYGISSDRLEEVFLQNSLLRQFRIKPYSEYIKSKHQK